MVGALIGALVAGAITWWVARNERRFATRLPVYQDQLLIMQRVSEHVALQFPTWPPDGPSTSPFPEWDGDIDRLKVTVRLFGSEKMRELQREWGQKVLEWNRLVAIVGTDQKNGDRSDDARERWNKLAICRGRIRELEGHLFSTASKELGGHGDFHS